jgi:hypothetical protein
MSKILRIKADIKEMEQKIYDLHIELQKAEAEEMSDEELRELWELCMRPLVGRTDALNLKDLEKRFEGGVFVLSTKTHQFEVHSINLDIAVYADIMNHRIYCKQTRQSYSTFKELSGDENPQLMVEWQGLYVDLSHLF